MGRITWSSDDSSVALLLNGGMISQSQPQPQPQPTNSSAWPPGFRFHPTDEELILYYLKRKVCGRRMKLNMIGEIDVYKCEPWELPEKSVLQTGDKQWFFFSPRDKKYPNGARANRATKRGYWKATGKDRSISRNSRPVGVKKTLIFYDGRAPHGKRTDWVMHEYTMDEGEVKNCNPMQDSYALYKIYRKSGPGPKNGEQYGAPFREEEWSDDDQTHDRLQNTSNMKVLMPELIDRASFDSILGGDQYLPHIDDVEEVLQNLVDEEVLQNLVDEPKLSHHPYDFNLTEVDGDDRRAQPKEPLPWEAFSAEEANEASESFERFTDANMSHNIKNPVTSPSHPCEAPEVTSALDCSLQEDPYRTEGDFVELNDLVDILEPCNSSLENDINDSFLFHDMVGLCEPELYFDAPLSLPDVIVAQDRTAHQPYYMDGFVVDPTTSQLDYPHSFAYNDGGRYYHTTSSELWAHDQNFNVIMEQESSQVSVVPAVPGNVYEGSQTNLNEGAQPSQGGSDIIEGDGAGSSWFTSAVHTLLDSIPTHPASASESALINRAFERVSSFGAVRIGAARNNLDVVPAAGASARTAGRKIDGNGGFLFISVIVVLLAVLWVLVMGVGRW